MSKRGIQRFSSDKNRNKWWRNIVKKDGGFEYEIYKNKLTEQEALDLEIKLINEIGIDKLVNLTHGGDGGDTLSEHPNLKKIGEKISNALSGRKNGNYNKGYYYWWVIKFGKKKADEMKIEYSAKLSRVRRGKKLGPNPNLCGDKNPSKREGVRKKISIARKNTKRIKCDICGKYLPPHTMKRHKLGKWCK